jgi:eukaryotic-like serine/threonine-protein kinase
MASEHWQQVKQIFNSALEYEPTARAEYLSRACAGNRSLRDEVESLISSYEKAGSFIDAPAYQAVAESLLDETLAKGRMIGHYEILGTLGKGGMGVVYLATDTKLGRKVALKFLPAFFTSQKDRLRRFEQEARAASALNHPNILTVHEVGEADGLRFIATEFVEGETLRQRIVSGPGDLASSLNVAEQIASALAAAHAEGIVHRDIKPDNVMLRRDGYVKVLDFGLAKLTQQQEESKPEDATLQMIQTSAGMVMGTAQYMSPEQARGLEVDARSDIWSLGVVLYETITGRAPFDGPTTSDVIVAVLDREPDWTQWPNGQIAAELEWIVRKSLRKEKEARYQTASELQGDLKNLRQRSEQGIVSEQDPSRLKSLNSPAAISTGETEPKNTAIASNRTNSPARSLAQAIGRQTRIFVVLLLLVTVALAFGVYWFAVRNKPALVAQTGPGNAEAVTVLNTTQITSGVGLDLHPSLSPDGNTIAYSSDRGNGYEIFVRPLTAGGRELQLTSDGSQNFEPAWSPDAKLIAFHSKKRGGVWVVPALGGVAKQITEFGSYPAWSPDGSSLVIQSSAIGDDLFAMASGALLTTTLWQVSASGGTPKQITKMGDPPGGHGSPSWSPDGTRIAFTSYDPAGSGIWTITPDGLELKKVGPGIEAIYAPDGRDIYFVSFGSNNLNFGLSKLRISETGEPVGVPIEVRSTGPNRIKRLTVSADGKKLAYTALSTISNLWSVLMRDNEGAGPPVALMQDSSYRNSNPNYSPDGKRIAYHVSRVGGGEDIWLIDPDGKNLTQLTTNPSDDLRPGWFPDGNQIAFQSYREGKVVFAAINVKTGVERSLFEPAQDFSFPRLSPDGKQIVFNSKKSGTTNLWVFSIETGAVRQLTFDQEAAGFATWSPDGKNLAFQIKRGDDTHVAVMPSAGGEIEQLTAASGQSFVHSWSADGDKIAFAGFRNGVWNVWWLSRTSKLTKQVTNYTKLNAFVRYPTWSPLGDRIVYEYTETAGNIWLMEFK